MIAKLKGLIDFIGNGFVILDVQGVGYRLFCSNTTLSKLPPIGKVATLHTEMQVREDSIKLFGFIDSAEKEFFLLLTSVQGVGSKGAFSLLSTFSQQDLSMAIACSDSKTISKANGIGAKTALRIITELKDKVGSVPIENASTECSFCSNSVSNDAISALINLGYAKMDASVVVSKIIKNSSEDLTFDKIVREALRELSK
ncbi:MAG: Holliday junction branch migration protein RuvA [Alphaproteobacteria bacterium]|nr:Holliday junction branch migration protein RuvA [Alphaproteobacteria bacterium]